MRVLIGGAGFAPRTPVYFSGHASPKVDVLSPGFLIATLPPGADASQVSVGGLVAAPTISAPASGATGVASTFTIKGSGVSGDTVTVTEGGVVVHRDGGRRPARAHRRPVEHARRRLTAGDHRLRGRHGAGRLPR